jgi:subtilisin family serine protease
MYKGMCKFSWLLLTIILFGCGGQNQSPSYISSEEETKKDSVEVDGEVDLVTNPEKTNRYPEETSLKKAPSFSTNIITDLNIFNTFTWNWSTNGGGNGTYRFKLGGEEELWTETTSTSYSVKGNGLKILYVQEGDNSGNWTTSASAPLFIPKIIITDQSGNRLEEGAVTDQQKLHIMIDTVVELDWRGLSEYSVTVENGRLQNWQGSGQHYTGEIVADGQGAVRVTLLAGEYRDKADWMQKNGAASLSWHYDIPLRILSIDDQETNEDQSLAIPLQVVGEDSDDIKFTVSSNREDLIKSLGIDNSHLTIVPKPHAYGEAQITLSVSESGNTHDQSFILTIKPQDDPAEIVSILEDTAREDSIYTYQLEIEDIDSDQVLVTIEGTGSEWLTFADNQRKVSLSNKQDGQFKTQLKGTALNNHVGENTLILRVADKQNVITKVLSIVVLNTNDNPTISGVPLTAISQHSNYSFEPTVNDDDANDRLGFGIENKPEWAKFDHHSGRLSGLSRDVGITKDISIWVKDREGAKSYLPAFDLEVIDNIPPSPPLVTEHRDTSNTFKWVWSSNGGGNGTYRFKLDGEEEQWIETTSTTYSFKGDGVKTLYVQERDDSGNWSASASARLFIPKIIVKDLSENRIEQGIATNQQKLNIQIDTSVVPWIKLSEYAVHVDNGTIQNWQGSGQHYTGEIVADGQGAVKVTIVAGKYSDKDEWEQINSVASLSWHYDAPPSSPNIVTDLNTFNTFTWNWSTNGGGNGTYRFKLDGEEEQWTETTSTSYSVKGNGLKILYVQEVDNSGNWSTSASAPLFIPIITIKDQSGNSLEEGAVTNQQKLHIMIDTVVEFNWWHLSEYSVTVENGRLQDWQGDGQHYTGDIIANFQGPVTVIIGAGEYSDKADWEQKNGAVSHSWVVDSDKPFKPVIAGFQGPTNSPEWSWNSGGNGNGLFRYRLASHQDWTETSENSFAPNYLEVGKFTLELQERDNAGNWSYSSYYTIHMAEYDELLEAASKFVELRLMPVDGKSIYQGNLTTVNLFKGHLDYSIFKHPVYGEVEITDPLKGEFTYQLAENSLSPSNSDYFEFQVVNAESNQSSSARIDIRFKSDPLYKYQWHLDNTGQTNFADNGGTVGQDLNLDSVISDGHTGKGITVGVVDDGLDINHEDLKDNVVLGSWDYIDEDSDPSWDKEKDQREGDHGTAVGGIIGAVGWNNTGVRGIAPDVKLKGFRFIGDSSTENEIDALGGSHKAGSSDIDIFNMSYGSANVFLSFLDDDLEEHLWMSLSESDDCDAEYCQGLRQGKGAIFVKAAGNGFNYTYYLFFSTDCPLAKENNLSCELTFMDGMSNHPGIINVAAIDANGKATTYSTQGAANWISAPSGEDGKRTADWSYSERDGQPATMTTDTSSCGAGYDSEYAKNEFNSTKPVHIENQNCNYTSTFNGTSAATPMVSGVAALILGANPQLTWRDVKYILAKTARKIDASNEVRGKVVVNNVEVETDWIENSAGFNFHNAYGFGAVDAAAAVKLALQFKDSPRQVGDFIKYPELDSGDIEHSLKPKTQFTETIRSDYEGRIEAVRIDIDIAYDYISDISIALVSPSGTRSVLVSPFNGIKSIGFFGDLFNDLFIDNPEIQRNPNWLQLSINALYGENMKGDWTIEFFDHLDEENAEDQEKRSWLVDDPDGKNAMIYKWKLKFYGHE